MNNGKILVIVNLYKRSHNLKDIVESVKKQTYKNWRIFITDDGGAEDSEAIAKEIIAKNPNLDIAYSKNSINLGEGGNLNAALIKNDGLCEFVAPLQDDCVYLDFDYFGNAVYALNNYKQANFIMGKGKNNGVPSNGWEENGYSTGAQLLKNWPIPMSWANGIYRYKVFFEVMIKKPAKNQFCGDSPAILRSALLGGGVVPQLLCG